ncbi:hypothetical protein V2G26_016453 [Clonostachys chloroleuca]
MPGRAETFQDSPPNIVSLALAAQVKTKCVTSAAIVCAYPLLSSNHCCHRTTLSRSEHPQVDRSHHRSPIFGTQALNQCLNRLMVPDMLDPYISLPGGTRLPAGAAAASHLRVNENLEVVVMHG